MEAVGKEYEREEGQLHDRSAFTSDAPP